jgi:hypothetical protein
VLPMERETTITYSDGDELVSIFSARKRDQTRLKRAGIMPKRGDKSTGLCYEVPLARFTWLVRAKARIARSRIVIPIVG